MKTLRKFTMSVLAVACAVACATPAQAGTIYSNIQPGDTFVVGVAIGIVPFVDVFNYAGVGFNAGQTYTFQSMELAVSLTAGQTYTFQSMELAVSLTSGPNVLDVYLMSSLGGLPNQVLESFALDNDLSTDPSTGLVTIDSVTHPELMAGQEYWVVAAGGPPTFASWQENGHKVMGPNVSGPTLTSLVRDSNANVVEALEVNGTAVPEPSSWMLMAGALLLCMAYSYRSVTIGSTRAARRAGK